VAEGVPASNDSHAVSMLDEGWTRPAAGGEWEQTAVELGAESLTLEQAGFAPVALGLDEVMLLDATVIGDGLTAVTVRTSAGHEFALCVANDLYAALSVACRWQDTSSTTSTEAMHAPPPTIEVLACPYCHTPVEDAPWRCDQCGTPHHHDCWAEGGGCAIPGCAPTDPRSSASAWSATAPSGPGQVRAGYGGAGAGAPQGPAGWAASTDQPRVSALPPATTSFTVRPAGARSGARRALVTCALVVLPVLAIVGTTNNWFSAITGRRYSSTELKQHQRAAQRRGYAEGHSAGYDEGHSDGYDEGHSDGYDAGYSAGRSVGFTAGCEAAVDALADFPYILRSACS
jgi:hypothetical protein